MSGGGKVQNARSASYFQYRKKSAAVQICFFPTARRARRAAHRAQGSDDFAKKHAERRKDDASLLSAKTFHQIVLPLRASGLANVTLFRRVERIWTRHFPRLQIKVSARAAIQTHAIRISLSGKRAAHVQVPAPEHSAICVSNS
jgi:hypothetical protein